MRLELRHEPAQLLFRRSHHQGQGFFPSSEAESASAARQLALACSPKYLLGCKRSSKAARLTLLAERQQERQRAHT